MMESESSKQIISNKYLRNLALLIAVVVFMDRLNGSIAVTSISIIAKTLRSTPSDITIAMGTYMLAITIFVPVGTYLAKNIGIKSTFILSIIIFMIGSLFSSISSSFLEYLSSQVFQGVGGACMVPIARLFVIQTSPKNLYIKMISLMIYPGLIAPIIAPFIGAWITHYFSWNWMYLINIPISLIMIAIFVIYFPKLKVNKTLKSKFDFIGFALLVAILSLLFVGFDFINKYGINQILAWLILASSGTLFFVFKSYLIRAKNPIFGLKPFKRVRSYRLSVLTGFLTLLTLGGTTYLIPLYAETELHMTPLIAGILMLVYASGAFSMKIITSFIFLRFGFKKPLILSIILCSVCLISIYLLKSYITLIIILLFLLGAIRNLGLSASQTLTFADIKKRYSYDASVLSNILRLSA
ncbi:MAG: MFS transporter, partial [Psittacicella sp.]